MDETLLQLESGKEPAPAAPELRRIACRPRRIRGLPMRIRLGLALGLCVALVLVRVIWPGSAAALRRWVVGDGSEQVQQAFFRMEQALEEGDGMDEAWAAFRAELSDAPA